MSAEDLLRRYLEQRREMGETELVLDGLSVEDVMKLVGIKRGARSAPVERARPLVAESEGRGSVGEPASAGWRDALRASGATPEPLRALEPIRADDPPPPVDDDAMLDEPAEARDVAQPSTRPPRSAPFVEQVAAEPPLFASAPPTAPVAGLVIGSAERSAFPGELGEAADLAQLAELIKRCTRCDLYKTATNAVPGEGSPQADFMCVGEAPGAQEDATGRPFFGQAGQLLTKILQAVNLSREEVFILNVLKHRPPGNRNPLPDEVSACRPYLVRQVELVAPKVILALGTFAAQSLLETKLSIGKLRGSVHRYHGIPVIVTYHPAALLRNPAWKRPTWEDVQLARRILDSAGA
ncbi:MAG: uracil-DNA glycosylase [Gemmatimonadota bacterium]|nr:uracil-DNA glycosylase [Gemmatimonadota bacterium]